MDARAFTALGGQSMYRGRLVEVRRERFRYADGAEETREIVRHQGAVGIVAHDAEHMPSGPRMVACGSAE